MRIALAQDAGVPGDVPANLATVRRRAGEAARAGAALVIFPEAFLSGYNLPPEEIAALAGSADGETVRVVAEIAREAGIAVLCGFAERAPDDTVHNSAVLIDAGGATLAVHRKLHLFGDLDRRAFLPGDQLTLADLGGLRIGILICYDVEFPEAVRALALRGAHLVAVPTALMAPAHYVAELLVPARAIENQVYVAYCNRVGEEGDLTYIGRSCVAGPDGGLVAAGTTAPGLLPADVDAGAIAGARERFSYLDDRRGDLA